MGIFITTTIKKTKNLLLKSCIALIFLALLSPYAFSFYIKIKYDNLIEFAQDFIPNIKIVNHFKLSYFKSLLITEIKANDQKIILQHIISSKPYKKLIATITTRILNSDFKELTNHQLITNIGLDNKINSSIKDIKIKHDFYNNNTATNNNDNFNIKHINAVINQINLFYNRKDNNLDLAFYIPKITYNEGHDEIEINNLELKFNLKNFNNYEDKQINLSGVIDKLYLTTRSKPILRLSNFNIEQTFGKSINSNLNFVKLSIMEHKLGPLTSKWQLNNVPLSEFLNTIKAKTLPEMKEKFNNHKFHEIANYLFKNQPNLSLDLLLHVGDEKLKVLTDIILNSNHEDWLTAQDILDSLNINVAAKLPKTILFELVTFLMSEKQKRANHLQLMYNPDNKNKRNLPRAYLKKDPKELEKELEWLVYQKITYLLKNKIITEHQDGFSLDLSIAEGTFYSRMNPFNIFSF